MPYRPQDWGKGFDQGFDIGRYKGHKEEREKLRIVTDYFAVKYACKKQHDARWEASYDQRDRLIEELEACKRNVFTQAVIARSYDACRTEWEAYLKNSSYYKAFGACQDKHMQEFTKV